MANRFSTKKPIILNKSNVCLIVLLKTAGFLEVFYIQTCLTQAVKDLLLYFLIIRFIGTTYK